MDVAKVVKASLLTALAVLLLWPIQYLFVVWVVLLWRVFVVLLKVVGFAAVLIFIPFIGWAILFLVWLVKRGDKKADQRHAEMMAALGAPVVIEGKKVSVWRPWLLDQLRTAWTA